MAVEWPNMLPAVCLLRTLEWLRWGQMTASINVLKW
jgi:hypothetical protein